VGEIIEELDRMDKAEFETRLTVEYDERFEYFAWPAALLLGVAWALGEGRFRRRRESVA
jgi:Ca-activated chloride channel family protein